VGFFLGGFLAFCVMAADRQWAVGIPLAAMGVAAAALGLLYRFGFLDAPDDSVARSIPLDALVPKLALAICAIALTAGTFALACTGYLGRWGPAVALPTLFLVVVASIFRARERPLLARHGFWVVALGTLLYLPTLGSFSLLDPWETHYGEVARDILARDDWISTWTPQSGWFWSKPVLDLWMQALSMGAFPVGFLPGEMLAAATSGPTPCPEWAVRLPTFGLSILALYAVYRCVARAFGRRTGFLAAAVLATSSQWFFLAHQSITDMPLVSTLSIAMALLLLAEQTDPERLIGSCEIRLASRRWRLGLPALALGVVLMTVLPQILYLVSRNVELQWVALPHGFRWHADDFWSGSKGNCDLPGNAPCARELAAYPSVQPAIQAAAWSLLLAALLWLCRKERRARSWYVLGAWYFAGLATLAKGPAGFALPAAVFLSHIAITGRWRTLTALELRAGLLILATVAGPWYVAMYARHGEPFWNELIGHHMIKRAFDHVSDLNPGDDLSFRYYVWQLGYALFPWTGLFPFALLGWPTSPPSGTSQGRGEMGRGVARFLATWFLFAFALFTAMPTKFHHYIFPAVPPAAALIGIALGRALDALSAGEARRNHLMMGSAALLGATLTGLVGRDLVAADGVGPGSARLLALFTYDYHRPWPSALDFRATLSFVTLFAAASILAMALRSLRRHAVTALVAGSLAFAAWGLDVYLPQIAPHWGQRELFETYVKQRKDASEPIIAFRMNWLGEYFYSSNRIPAFGVAVSNGASLARYVEGKVERGTTTIFFVTEHGSVTALQGELGPAATLARVTDTSLNNKFVLVRAVWSKSRIE